MLDELGSRQRIAVKIVERDDLVVVDQPPRERRPDEAGAAGDEDAFASQSHAASLSAGFNRPIAVVHTGSTAVAQ